MWIVGGFLYILVAVVVNILWWTLGIRYPANVRIRTYPKESAFAYNIEKHNEPTVLGDIWSANPSVNTMTCTTFDSFLWPLGIAMHLMVIVCVLAFEIFKYIPARLHGLPTFTVIRRAFVRRQKLIQYRDEEMAEEVERGFAEIVRLSTPSTGPARRGPEPHTQSQI